jgi:spore coat polysaccharide biosynthesis predicted glycosyltransferase SpsG
LIFAIRADAGVVQGTGHVMRCLSLAEKLLQKGHRVGLFTNTSEITWLEAAISASGVEVFRVKADELVPEHLEGFPADWLIVDSYQIPSEEISAVNKDLRVLAIVDGDARGITASAYLDTNLFSEKLSWPAEVEEKLLAGSKFALVRDGVLIHKRSNPELIVGNPPKVLVFLGGSDPYGFSPLLAKALARVGAPFEATFIAPETSHESIRTALGDNSSKVAVIGLTPKLTDYYEGVDVVISAAGTSAWDVCSLGVPALLLAVVDNQEFSLAQIAEHGLTLTNNLAGAGNEKAAELATQISSLLTNQKLRSELSEQALKHFDGLGRDRIEEFLTAAK